jgi:hypothetical protein
MIRMSLCTNRKCKKKDTCRKFRERPVMWEKYIYIEDTENCKFYWKKEENEI